MTIKVAEDNDLPAARRVATAALDRDSAEAGGLADLLWQPLADAQRIRLVALSGQQVAGVALGTVSGSTAHLDLIAVIPERQRAGLGRRLLDGWEDEARRHGATDLHVGGNTRTYAWPGVDVSYTPAVCMLRKAGYKQTRVAVNMDLPLTADAGPTTDQLAGLAKADIAVRRATAADEDELRRIIPAMSSTTWLREVLLGLDRTFLAVRGESIVGFASHGVYRRPWFGPIATDPRERGHGIGEVLLRLCLQDMWGGGVRLAQIGWVDEAIPFYAKTVGARCGRVFWLFEKPPSTTDQR